MAITSASYSIKASIYKEYADQLMYPIKKIWQAFLESGKLLEGAT